MLKDLAVSSHDRQNILNSCYASQQALGLCDIWARKATRQFYNSCGVRNGTCTA